MMPVRFLDPDALARAGRLECEDWPRCDPRLVDPETGCNVLHGDGGRDLRPRTPRSIDPERGHLRARRGVNNHGETKP